MGVSIMASKGSYKFMFLERGKLDSFKLLCFDNFQDLFAKSDEVYDVPDVKFLSLIKYSDYNVDIYKPFNDFEDLLTVYISPKNWASKEKGKNTSHFKGRLFSKILPLHAKLGVLEIFKRVYQTNIPSFTKISILDNDDNLVFTYESKIIRYQDYILVISCNEADNEFRSGGVPQIFNPYELAIAVIQNEELVSKNEQFLYLEKKYSDISYKFEDIRFKGLDHEHWLDIYNKMVNGDLLSYNGELEVHTHLDKDCYFLAYVSPEIYRGKPAVKFYLTDVTRIRLAEEKSELLKKNLHIAQKLNKFALLELDNNSLNWDSQIYDILELNNEEIERIPQGHNILDDYTAENDFIKFHKWFDDKDGSIYENRVEITTARGNTKYLSIYSMFTDDNLDDNSGIISYIQDITDVVELQKELISVQSDILSGIDEEEILLKEIHHRVKNNLQIIISLLNIDYYYNKNDPETIVKNTMNRIDSMALMHEKTYQSDSLDGANVKDYIESQASSIIDLYGASNIDLITDIDDVELSMDIIIPLGLMINELILNTIKYAFPNGKGHLSIRLKSKLENMILIVSDDGVGLPDNFDIHSANSLGMTIIQSLTQQIDGELVNLKPDKGTSIRIKFPIV